MGFREALAQVPLWGRWLAAVTALRLIVAAVVPVTPEETYHWTYAQHLDWGYLDHPPMIAWAIAVGCALFGHSALAIRFVPLLFATGACALLARLAHRLYTPRAAVFAVVLFSIQPAAFAIGMAGFPDSPLLFFWALALALVLRAVDTGRGAWWLAAGAALGAAMLSKYTSVFLAAGVLAHLALSPRDRRWLATPWPYAGALAALAVFSPVLVWNATHDWASLRFQSVNRFALVNEVNVLMGATAVGQFWLGVLPLTLPLAVVVAVRAGRSARPQERLLFWTSVPMALFFIAIGFGSSTHVLWPLPAFAGLAVAMAGAADAGAGAIARFYERRTAWLAGVSAVAFIVGAVHLAVILPGVPPARILYGWAEAAERARSLYERLPADSVYIGVGRKYLCTSELAYHLRTPGRVHGKHLVGGEGMQFEYWSTPRDVEGRDALVVLSDGCTEDGSAERLRDYFGSVEEAGTLEVPVGDSKLMPTPPVRFAFYVGRGYRDRSRTAPGGSP